MPKGVYKRTKPGWSYRLTKETDERIAKRSKALKGKSTWNKNLTKETDMRVAKNAKNISKALKGTHRSEETKLKISKSHKGMKYSEEVKANMKGRCGVYIRTEACKEILSKSRKKYYMQMTKKEKIKLLKPWIQAGNKARQEQWNQMTKEERVGFLKSWIEAGEKASQKANPSSIERDIWKVLDKFGISYETQVSFNNGHFIVDIYIPKQRLIVECNGDYWHSLPERKLRDEKLKSYAKNNNYKLVELSESKIRENPEQAFLSGLENLESCSQRGTNG